MNVLESSYVAEPILRIQGLKTYFYTLDGITRAVDSVGYEIGKGEVVGLVGESGCGKTVSALSILRLIQSPPGRIVEGRIDFGGRDLLDLVPKEMEDIRGNEISMIFQEPMTSLNPIFNIGDQIGESLRTHRGMGGKEALERTVQMLKIVGLPSPQRRVLEYPHQLSGGMRQRVMIAMALACDPQLLIADEPTTALDVTIQAQILDLMLRLREELKMAILLITHDLGVIAEVAERVIVMYSGKVVEEARVSTIFKDPHHPYTIGLMGSIPRLDRVARKRRKRERLREIPGIVPSLYELPEGCNFEDRCDRAMEICRDDEPQLREIETDHYVSCWLYQG